MKTYILFVLRVLLGLTFLISGISKFTDLHAFATTIREFGLVPESIGGVMVTSQGEQTSILSLGPC